MFRQIFNDWIAQTSKRQTGHNWQFFSDLKSIIDKLHRYKSTFEILFDFDNLNVLNTDELNGFFAIEHR